jgi:hypothetical protein
MSTPFDLMVFPQEDDTYIAISRANLEKYGTTGKVSDLGKDVQDLYHMMRSGDVDMAHSPWSDQQAQQSVMIFGTFYVNLGAFRR